MSGICRPPAGKFPATSASACSRPLLMGKPKLSRAREKRVVDEIVVDAYTSDERAIGRHCYLDDRLRFPFKAICVAVRKISPLRKGGALEVRGMAPQDDCMRKVFVTARREEIVPNLDCNRV
jgi:hypothetical protein